MSERATADGTTRVVCVGNSLTQNGEGVLQWPQQLDAMTAASVVAINLGHGGWTTEPFGVSDPNNALSRVYPLEVIQALSPTASRNWIVLWEGRNHLAYGPTARQAADAYWRYTDGAADDGYTGIWVGTVIDTNPLGFSDAIRLAFNDLVRAECGAHGCSLLDLAIVPGLDNRDSPLFAGDQIHLTGAGGYATVAATVKAELALPSA